MEVVRAITMVDGSEPGLGRRAMRGGSVTLIGQAGKVTIQLVGLVVLSRLLTPSDFGLVAMLFVVVALGELVRDFGLTQAAMQARDLSHQQASNMFWINLGLGGLLAAGLMASTPLVVNFFDEPRLTSIAPYLATTMVLNGAQAQFQVRLAREFRFVALTMTDLGAQALGLAVAISCALNGVGYRSLVAQMVVVATAMLVARVIATPWRPSIPRRTAGFASFLRYGGHLGLAQLLTYASSNADTYVIGSRWGVSPLGIYNRGFQLLVVPVTQLLTPLTNVALPVLARTSSDRPAMFALLSKAQFALGFGLIWVFATTAALSDQMVSVVLGPKWHASGDIFRILAAGGSFQVLSFVGYWAFLASGRTRELLSYNMITKTMGVSFVLVGSAFGIQGVAWGYSIGLAVSWPICVWWLRRCLGLPARQFISSGALLLVSGLAAFSVALVVVSALSRESMGIIIVTGVLASAVAYGGVLMLAPSSRESLRGLRSSVRNAGVG